MLCDKLIVYPQKTIGVNGKSTRPLIKFNIFTMYSCMYYEGGLKHYNKQPHQ